MNNINIVQRITNILWKKLNENILTHQEHQELAQWLAESVYNRDVFEEMSDSLKLNEGIKFLLRRDSQLTWNKIAEVIDSRKHKNPS